MAFSPDGTRLASGADDRTVGIWDVESGELPARLRGHTENVMVVAFSLDGKRLASASDDKTVRIWETEVDTARAMWDAPKRHREETAPR